MVSLKRDPAGVRTQDPPVSKRDALPAEQLNFYFLDNIQSMYFLDFFSLISNSL